MALLIRRAGITDLERLAELVVACFEPAWSRSAIEGALRARETRACVAESIDASDEAASPAVAGATADVTGAMVGFVLARRILDVVEIDLVGVAPAARRHGVAARLLAHLIEAERCAGASRAQLELSSANRPAAALYAGMGFVVVGRRPRYYPDGHDALLLSRALG